MFWIRYTTRNEYGALVPTEVALRAPSEVDYPEARLANVKVTQDGAVVIARPLRDPRPRKWIWRGHSPYDVAYANQWALLEALETRARLVAGLPPTVDVWEDTSGTGGFARKEGNGARIYTAVRIVQATRTPRGGGPVNYESVLEFFIADPTYQAF